MPRVRRTRAEREEASHYEVCECGHPRADHGDVMGGVTPGLVGHGVCMVEGCSCPHYTWTPKTHAPSGRGHGKAPKPLPGD